MLSMMVVLCVASPPRVALLSSAGETTELRLQPLGAVELAPVVASLHHADGSSVVGAVAGKLIVATATTAVSGDLSYASSLFRLEPGRPARALVDRVAIAARPVVIEARVFVARGRSAGDGVDELTIDEVNVESGATRTVYSTRGHFTWLAGALGRELVVYDVSAHAARLVLVHVDTLGVRVARDSMPPLAHDFVVDEPRKRLLYTLGEPGTERYALEETSLSPLAAKARHTVTFGDSVALLPTPWPDGRVLHAVGAGQGLTDGESTVLASHGPGYERVRLFVDGIAVGLHEVPSDFPRAFAVRVKDGADLRFVSPPAARLDVAGVLP